MAKIVVLDGYTENPGDLSWSGLEALGELTVYDRTPADQVVARIGDADIVYTNKTPITREVLDACPQVRFIGVLATGYNVVDYTAAKEKGIPIHMHSDGDIRTLVDDLIDGGVEVINLQDLVNGVDWIARKFAGKVCVDLDIDRQNITCFGTPADIDRLIREEITSIGRKEGGLILTYGLYHGTPLKNVKALMDALERYMGIFR